jgi:hypothetical protein
LCPRIPGECRPPFRDDVAHHSGMISPLGACAGRLWSAPLARPKERPDASRENHHAPGARSSSLTLPPREQPRCDLASGGIEPEPAAGSEPTNLTPANSTFSVDLEGANGVHIWTCDRCSSRWRRRHFSCAKQIRSGTSKSGRNS